VFVLIMMLLSSSVFGVTRIVVYPNEPVRKISPMFFGVNVLFWIDGDAALKNGRIVAELKNLPVGVLRFPGGTAAENYYWQTNTLADKYSYPFHSGPGTLDFDKFVSLVKEVGARADVIVNTRTWVSRGDIADGIKEAVAWVRYCKNKGYHVRYWEIGNEPYLNTAVNAREYAEVVNRYAAAMKKVDPTILIGAAGPSDPDFIGKKDRLSGREQAWLSHIEGRYPLHKVLQIQQMTRTVAAHTRPPKDARLWWPTFVRICGANVDFLVIHDYFYNARTITQLPKALITIEAEFKKHFPDKTYPIFMSEFNVGARVPASKQPLELFDIISAMLRGGVNWSCFWPLRFPHQHWTRKALLHMNSMQPRAPYMVLHFLAQRLVNSTLVRTGPNDLGAYAVKKGGKLTVFVSGRTLQRPTTIEVKIRNAKVGNVTVLQGKITGSGAISTRKTQSAIHRGRITATLAPREFDFINFQVQGAKQLDHQ
jgi:hypothetical protein